MNRVPIWQRPDLVEKFNGAGRRAEVKGPSAWRSVPGPIRGFVWLLVLGSLVWFGLQFAAGWQMAKDADRARECAEMPTVCQWLQDK